MSSSDSFFVEWISQRNIDRHCKLYTVGDLSYQDAHHFYNDRAMKFGLKQVAPPFEEIFPVLGGRMYHINDFLRETKLKGGLKPDTYSETTLTFDRVQRALLLPKEFQSHLPEATWTKEDLADIIKAMIPTGRFMIHVRIRPVQPSVYTILYKCHQILDPSSCSRISSFI